MRTPLSSVYAAQALRRTWRPLGPICLAFAILGFGLSRVGHLSEFVHPRGIDGIQVSLVQEDEENQIISETGEAVQQRHVHDEGKEIVDEGVERLVDHGAPGHVCHALELVVDEELRRHHDEAEGVDKADETADDPRVPALVLVVHEAVRGEAHDARRHRVQQMLRGDLVILAGSPFGIALGHVQRELRDHPLPLQVQLEKALHLPHLDPDADHVLEQDHPARVVVQEVEEGDHPGRQVHAVALEAQALRALVLPPEAHVILEGEDLEEHVQQADEDREAQEVRIRVQQDLLQRVLLLRGTHAERGLLLPHVLHLHLHHELPHAHAGQADVQRQGRDAIAVEERAVDAVEAITQGPELVVIQNRIVVGGRFVELHVLGQRRRDVVDREGLVQLDEAQVKRRVQEHDPLGVVLVLFLGRRRLLHDRFDRVVDRIFSI
mmetsp:Transcript_16844/g.64143  ORF Transcript_16844/g.64143 Transcript_16844/m.64143 type:complete len:436 (+) Transcript_16844:745-2052(+)